MRYIGYTGNPWQVRILKPGKVIRCFNMDEMNLKYKIYCDYQNTCRFYEDEF